MKTNIKLILFFLIATSCAFGQILKPVFDKAEYIETLKMNQKVHVTGKTVSRMKVLLIDPNVNLPIDQIELLCGKR